MPFAVDERAVNDYYPFGMLVKERSWTSENYRYGYNGKENDNEVKGTGNSIDYGARIYDPRVARFSSLDPDRKKYAWNSPYDYAENQPINFIDLLGKGKHAMYLADIEKKQDGTFKVVNERPALDDNGKLREYTDNSPDDQPVTFYTYENQHVTTLTAFTNEAGEFFRADARRKDEVLKVNVKLPFQLAIAAFTGGVGGIIIAVEAFIEYGITLHNAANDKDNHTSLLPLAGKAVGGDTGEQAGNVIDFLKNARGVLKGISNLNNSDDKIKNTSKLLNDMYNTTKSLVDIDKKTTTSNTKKTLTIEELRQNKSNAQRDNVTTKVPEKKVIDKINLKNN